MGMAAPAAGSGKNPRPNVNITPLVDVALVVLIIFMVVAPMLTKTFSLSIPPDAKDDTPPPEQSDEPLVLTIDKAGTMRINREVVQPNELAAVIPDRLARAKHKVLHFDADDQLPYGQVVAAVDKCREAGAESIAIVTKKLPEP
ncbi:MAG: biopolymer transporter ExbD [Polyangiaceae bacterium]|nr:biopolymer transporter ExbD [Polyangiaceae bacterium]